MDRATAFVDTTSTTIGANIKKIGFLKGMGMALEFQRLWKNPDGKRLEDVLPADLNARFMALKARYAPKDRKMLKRRPVFAAEDLWRAAVVQSKLSTASEVVGTVHLMAGERKVERLFVSVTVDDPLALRAALDELGRIPIEAEIACMRSVLARFDTDLATTRERAVAWAEGDVVLMVPRGTPVSTVSRTPCRSLPRRAISVGSCSSRPWRTTPCRWPWSTSTNCSNPAASPTGYGLRDTR